jgi:hypothetical protein
MTRQVWWSANTRGKGRGLADVSSIVAAEGSSSVPSMSLPRSMDAA